MPLILNIETATEICSVALSEGKDLIGLEEEIKANSHSTLLTILTDQLLKKSKFSLSDVDAIALSAGPGSFTGLRIGAAAAKGFCYALDKPLITVPTLLAMANGMIQQIKEQQAFYCPVINSIKKEVFAGLYDFELNELVAYKSIDESLKDIEPEFKGKKIFVFGPDVKKVRSSATYPNIDICDLTLSAKYMVTLSNNFFKENRFAQLETFEPFYLKQFIPRTNL